MCKMLNFALLFALSVTAMAFGPPQDVAPTTHYAEMPLANAIMASATPPAAMATVAMPPSLAADIVATVDNTLKGWEPAQYAMVVDADGNEKPLTGIAREAALRAALDHLAQRPTRPTQPADWLTLFGLLVVLATGGGLGWLFGRGKPRTTQYTRP